MAQRETPTPPRLVLWLMERVVWNDDYEYASGDFTEMFGNMVQADGAVRARIWCWSEVICSLPGFINNSIYWGIAMLRNYVKVALRNIARQKGYSFINIFGLAVGVACCLVISLWVYRELNYDAFHVNADRIYHVLAQGQHVKNNPSTPAPLAPVLKENYPEVEYATRRDDFGRRLVSNGEESFYEKVYAFDADFLRMFSFEIVHGDLATLFDGPRSVVLTEDLAAKYFGELEPLGRTLSIAGAGDFTVTGVMASPPDNTTMSIDIAVPFDIYKSVTEQESGMEMDWGWFGPQTYVMLRGDVSAEEFGEKVADVMPRFSDNADNLISLLPWPERYAFFTDAWTSIGIFSAIGLLVILVASINFINLSTARSSKRAREVGMRKVVGAFRRNIIHQFLGETMVMALMAVGLAVVIVIVALPSFNEVTGLSLSMDAVPLPYLLGTLLVIAVLLGLAAGLYPAVLVSAFMPQAMLRGGIQGGRSRSLLRRALVVMQFAVSAFLIMGSLVIYRQVEFATGKDTGYDREAVITISLTGGTDALFPVMKADMLADSRILGVAGSATVFPDISWSTDAFQWDGQDSDYEVHSVFNGVDYDFIETMQLELVAGRSFSEEITSHATGYLVNETLAQRMGFGQEEIVGTNVSLWDNPGQIIGVMKDFHHRSMVHPIQPVVFFLDRSRIWQMTVRLGPNDVEEALAVVRAVWDKHLPAYPFEYAFLDDEVEQRYSGSARMGDLGGMFAGLALLVACLGMLGLASFAAEVRAKEIAVRKVLGAPARSTIMLLSRELAVCVLVANVVAWPVGYLVMNQWLQDYAYRTSLNAGLVLVPLIVTCIAAALAVGYQAFRAANANPVERLRCE
jgi:putative ABC transport system permease protein